MCFLTYLLNIITKLVVFTFKESLTQRVVRLHLIVFLSPLLYQDLDFYECSTLGEIGHF